jgi:Ti-type conjugative transfer relaxase TraA
MPRKDFNLLKTKNVENNRKKTNNMAIFHFSGTIISRSQGRSAIACAAYRAAERLYDERYGKTQNYSKKKDVAHTEILLPEKALPWMKDREKLWNNVEKNEKRKNSQLAREFNFALPRELTIEQNIELTKQFVHQAFVSKGMIADLAIHNDKMPDGTFQPHAHVMLTLREVTPDGFGRKAREWNAKENLLKWRESWAETVNQHLFLHGHDIKIDHRTLQEQGIHLEPQYKIGPTLAKERFERLADHQRIAKENGERILKDPSIALNALTHQQSTFTHQDLARFIHRHTIDAEQFQEVYDKVKNDTQVVYLGKDANQRERFTTQEMLATEAKMLSLATQLPKQLSHKVNETTKTKALSTRGLTQEQQFAFEHLLGEGDLKCVIGYAGTGKSYLLGAARKAWEKEGYSVIGATLSGIAAQNLTGSSGIESRTLASRFYYWDKGEQLLTNQDILVIDEAGMIGSRQMTKILEQVEKHHAKVVLLGDPEQLQAIEAGAPFRAISEQAGYVALTDIRRQCENWQKEATRELATGKTKEALKRYQEHYHVHEFETKDSAKKGLITLWNDVRIHDSSKTQIMLAYTRSEVRELNDMARSLRRDQNELGQEHIIQTVRGERSLSIHDRVYFLKNDRQLGVMNGTLGTVETILDKDITIRLDRDERLPHEKPRTVRINLDEYHHLDHGYAATIHKAQGVTVDRSYILTSSYLDRHATYVAATRHRESVDIFWNKAEFTHERALAESLGRERVKDVTTDYFDNQRAFTHHRNIERPSQEGVLNRIPELSKKPLKVEKRHEKLLQKITKDYHHAKEKNLLFKHDDFKHFKTQFEIKNPIKAKLLQESLRPRHERLAIEALKEIKRLEKAIKHSKFPHIERYELKKYVIKVASQPEIMNYFQQKNQAISQKIQELVKSHGRDRGRDR